MNVNHRLNTQFPHKLEKARTIRSRGSTPVTRLRQLLLCDLAYYRVLGSRGGPDADAEERIERGKPRRKIRIRASQDTQPAIVNEGSQ
jgi:hypothetical protein